MSVAEMRESLIAEIKSLPDEKVEAFFEKFNAITTPTIDAMYKDAVAQYSDTLKTLAQ